MPCSFRFWMRTLHVLWYSSVQMQHPLLFATTKNESAPCHNSGMTAISKCVTTIVGTAPEILGAHALLLLLSLG
jgi:hypothetical protein